MNKAARKTLVRDLEQDVGAAKTPVFSTQDPLKRYRLVTEFTRELDELTRKHGIAIVGGHAEPIDLEWNGPDAEKWEQYALNEDDQLMRGFWSQHPTVISR